MKFREVERGSSLAQSLFDEFLDAEIHQIRLFDDCGMCPILNDMEL